MTVALYVLECLVVGGGTVAFLLIKASDEERAQDDRSAPAPVPRRRPRPGPGAQFNWVDDLTLWERELLSDDHLGSAHDQRMRRNVERWARESRRRRGPRLPSAPCRSRRPRRVDGDG